jgi:hypothetical protein
MPIMINGPELNTFPESRASNDPNDTSRCGGDFGPLLDRAIFSPDFPEERRDTSEISTEPYKFGSESEPLADQPI